jgi:hypothetical protein
MRKETWLFSIVIAFVAVAACAQQNNSDGSLDARCLIGMQGLKHNAEGVLTLENGNLQFASGRSAASVSTSSIEAIFTGSESTQNGGKELEGNVSKVPDGDNAAPSPILNMKVDVLTVAFRDDNGGLHAAVFAMPKGSAAGFRTSMISQGAHSDGTDAKAPPAATRASTPSPNQRKRLSASAILIEPVNPGTTGMPAEFRMAIYEHLVEQVQESGLFKSVYRSGDRAAANIADLVTLRTTAMEFKQGNEREREVTYYALGGTKISVNVQILNRDGDVLLDHKVVGRVVVLFENLSASHYVAIGIKNLLSKNF